MAAVKQNGWAIQFIINPSEAVHLTAVNEYREAIQGISNPTEEIIKIAFNLSNETIASLRDLVKLKNIDSLTAAIKKMK
jgi:hypothetical protein